MKKRIGLVSLGCPKNLVDSEIMLGRLKKEDFEIVNEKESAEILIVNTCGFIESAKQESINTILEMAECKKKNCELLIVTGCLAERYRDKIIEEIPEVDAVVGTGGYGEITKVIEDAYSGSKPVLYGKLEELEYLRNNRVVSTGKGYAYIKIAEGCDNCCTYCIIPSLRGHYRSRKIEEIVDEARDLARQGIKEIILVAQDTTRYGTDLYKERKLVELIRKISEIESIQWVRILYCYPEEIDDNLIQEFVINPKLCKYLDIPIQHASSKVLKAMGRRGTAEEVEKLLRKLREKIPGLILRTSLIVGFPGEDESDFIKLIDFVQEFMFDRLGVFIYSKEEGTPAARIRSQVNKKVKQQRHDAIMSLQREISRRKNSERLDKVYKTIVEGIAEDGIFYYGRTYAEAPEIDGLIYFTSREPIDAGCFIDVKILNTDEYDLIGEVVYESSQ